jgi:hypothetical protein
MVDFIEDSRPGHPQVIMSSKDETLYTVAAVLQELVEGNQTLASLNSGLVRSSELNFPRSCETINYRDCQGHKKSQFTFRVTDNPLNISGDSKYASNVIIKSEKYIDCIINLEPS